MPLAVTWIDLEIVILSEVSQTEKDKDHISDIAYMWNLKNGTNEPIYKTEIESQTWKTKLWLPRGKGGINFKTGIDIYTLLYLK